MGREVRRVPKDWEHPTDLEGCYIPLNNHYQGAYRGDIEDPNIDHYMPDWTDEEKTHLMMYEDTSEGTPISPAFEKAEALASWLAETKASAFGSQTANYEKWLTIINAGWAPSAVLNTERGLVSGVEAS